MSETKMFWRLKVAFHFWRVYKMPLWTAWRYSKWIDDMRVEGLSPTDAVYEEMTASCD